MESQTLPPRRRRLQMHLLTVIWMTLAGAHLIAANIFDHVPNFDGTADHSIHGFPLNAVERRYYDLAWYWRWRWHHVAIDIVVALAILFAVWYVSEWWIGRRTLSPSAPRKDESRGERGN